MSLLKHDTDRHKFGISFDITTGVGTRLYNSIGKNFIRSSTILTGVDDFHDKGPYKMKQCVLVWNGTKHNVYYKGTPEYETYKTQGNICIEYPLFYFSRPSNLTFIVSSKPFNGSMPSPMYYRDGHLYKKCYISKYQVNSSFKSQSGQAIHNNITIQAFRTGLANQGMKVLDYACWCSLTILAFIKYASLNVQEAVGWGYSDTNYTANGGNTGQADSVLSFDGGTDNNVNAHNQHIVALGLEDLWANMWQFCDGVVQYNGTIYYSNSLTQTNLSSTSSLGKYKAVSTKSATTTNNRYGDGGGDSYITSIAYDSTYPELLYPTTSAIAPGDTGATDAWKLYSNGATDNSIYHDGHMWRFANKLRLGIPGGAWNNSAACGLLFINFTADSSFTGSHTGCHSFVNTD